MKQTIVAIDPGTKGGIAYHEESLVLPECISMPTTDGDLIDKLRSIKANSRITPIAFVEQVGGYVKDNPAPGSAMFSFGDGAGFIRGALMAFGFRVEMIRPQEWQKVLGLGTAGAKRGEPKAVKDRKKREFKNRLKEKAQQLYPEQKVTLSTADALLILEYGKRRAL